MKRTLLAYSFMMVLVSFAPIVAQSAATAPTFVMMQGLITSYNGIATHGWCGVYAIVGQSAQVFMAWGSGKPTIAVIYNFYVARLLNTTLVALNYNSADLYIEGFWNVHNVTIVYQPGGSVSITDELLVDHGRGTLSVTNNWTSFMAQIMGIPPLVITINGNVGYYAIRSSDIPIGDTSGPTVGVPDTKINIMDLTHVARAYGATPGDPNLSHPHYDFSLDFNLDYIIDIYDLTTIAVNIGKGY